MEKEQCPCEKVIEGVKSAGWMSLIVGAIIIAGTAELLKQAVKKVKNVTGTKIT